jgi:hypothetical protein
MRSTVRLLVGIAVLAAVALSGCTSSSAPKKSASPTSTAPTPTSVAPTTSATPKPTPTPLSAFEQDPAVQGARKFFYQAGRTINSGHVIDSKLRGLVTPFVAKQMKQVTGPDVGTYYPGPAPFQPIGVVVVNAHAKTINGCLMANGWAQNRKTHKPAHPLQIAGVKVNMVEVSGRWVVDGLPFTKSVSCKGVTVKTQKW